MLEMELELCPIAKNPYQNLNNSQAYCLNVCLMHLKIYLKWSNPDYGFKAGKQYIRIVKLTSKYVYENARKRSSLLTNVAENKQSGASLKTVTDAYKNLIKTVQPIV